MNKTFLIFIITYLNIFYNFTNCQEDVDDYQLSIIHLNDLHAKYEPVTVNTGSCTEEENLQGNCYGGIARIVTAVNYLKDILPNAVVLNAGDVFQGTLLYTLFKWNISVEFTNRVPYDAVGIGNHEFDDGVSGYVPYANGLISTLVAANMDATNETEAIDTFKPSVVIERSGRKIGIIGCITPTTKGTSSSENMTFYDEIPTVQAEATRLKQEEGVDILILLSHSGYDEDIKIASGVPDLDIIVGGHSHTFLWNTTGSPAPSVETPIADYPTIITHSNNKKTAIVQAYAYGKYLGAITFNISTDGEILSWEGKPILLNSSIPEDQETKEALQPYVDEANIYGNREIGVTYVYLEKDCYDNECNLGNLYTDAFVYEQPSTENCWTRAAIAILNPGGIRAPLGETTIITYNQLVSSQPFQNTIDTVEMQGKDIITLFEQAAIPKPSVISRSVTDLETFQVSGVLITYNMSNPQGSRVSNIKLRCACCREPEYKPVDLEEWYNMAMPAFLADGGDFYTIIKENGRNRITGEIDVDLISRHLERESPIVQEVEGRTTIVT